MLLAATDQRPTIITYQHQLHHQYVMDLQQDWCKAHIFAILEYN